MAVVFERTDLAQAGTHIEHAGGDGGYCRKDIEAHRGQEQARHEVHQQGQINQTEQAGDDMFIDHPAAETDGKDSSALHHPLEFTIHHVPQQQDARCLQAAGCRTGAAADEHQRQQDQLTDRMPHFEIRRHKTGL